MRKTAAFSRRIGRVMGSAHMNGQPLTVRWAFMEAVAKVSIEDELSDKWKRFIQEALGE